MGSGVLSRAIDSDGHLVDSRLSEKRERDAARGDGLVERLVLPLQGAGQERFPAAPFSCFLLT